ncbi:MAG: 4Fe-4S dicluster domain-containing protein [Pseudomonadota bacterium]
MFYNTAIYVAMAIFGVGLIYKISGWFRFSIDYQNKIVTTPSSPRFSTAVKGIFTTVFSPKISKIAQVFVNDVLVQKRILKQDTLRWLMHILIFTGFMFLFFFHALDKIIVTPLFNAFYLSLNPFLLIAGLMVLVGIGIAAYRRHFMKISRLKTAAPDRYALMILVIIIVSGLVMELMKLTSFAHHQIFWTIHVYACLFGLAFLPFSKMFHIFTTPASLICNAVMDKDSNPVNIKTRQMMELDACTRCGTCSNRCSVATAFDSIGNNKILPSERMEFLKDYYADKSIGPKGLAAIQQGIYLCTNCDRCTVACPAGINLRELWFDVREEMIQRGHSVALVLTPFSYYRGLNMDRFDMAQYAKPLSNARKKITDQYTLVHQSDDIIPLTSANQMFKDIVGLSEQAGTYTYCFSCENCSTVCPVVENYEDPQKNLDLLPHQIMRSMGFGIKDLAMGSRMLWYCLTCYQCQEHCPQGVKVTDILYELKNISAKEAKSS